MKTGIYLLNVSAIALAVFLSGRLTVLIMNLGLEASPIWLPAGVALAAVLLGKPKDWVGVSIGSFALGLSLGASGLVAAIAAFSNTLGAITGAWLLHRTAWCPQFASLRDAVKFLALAVVLSPVVNATIGSFNACTSGLCPWSQFASHWWIVWLGDGIGILLMTPLLLLWLTHPLPHHSFLQAFPLRTWRQQCQQNQLWRWRTLETVVWLTLLPTLSWAVFCLPMQAKTARYPLEYLPIALIIWATLRFGRRGTVFSGFVISSFAFWGLTQQQGPFLMDANGNVQQAMFLLQTFVSFTTGTALVLAATVAERQQAERQLRFAAERERLLAETAQRIRRSLDLDEILHTTVAEVRHLLHADRVFIMRLDIAEHNLAVAESVDPQWTSVSGWIADQRVAQAIEALFKEESHDPPCGGKAIKAIDDTDQVEKLPLLAEYYRYCQVRASIGVPIMVCHKMFGILLVNQCSAPRHWQPLEINLLEQLATQVEIAIQQGQLYQHLQTLATSLEEQVQERTAELQERMQELQSLNQVKDLLLHAVAHDLRTPLQGMLMVLSSLRSKHDTIVPVPCAKFDRMIQSCDHQLHLLDALLEGHADDKPVAPPPCQLIHLAQVLETTLTTLKPIFVANQVTLNNQVSANLPSLKANPLQLQQVFESLLVNAVKHNPPGLALTLTAAVSEPSDPSARTLSKVIRCTVADNGQGLSQDQCDRLFRLYIRGIENQHLTGIGLGLHRCWQIITAHGGQIGVTSQLGQGSEFWFTLPIAPMPYEAKPRC